MKRVSVLEPVFYTFKFYLKAMTFPQYRKLEGFQRYYEIRDDRTFVEVTVMNGKINSSEIVVTQFPEMLRIKDMLNQEWNYRLMEDAEIELYFGKDKS